jgi:hypothetical protein
LMAPRALHTIFGSLVTMLPERFMITHDLPSNSSGADVSPQRPKRRGNAKKEPLPAKVLAFALDP